MSRPSILLIDPAAAAAEVLTEAFTHQATILRAQSIAQAEAVLSNHPVAVIVCRDDLPGETGIMFYSRRDRSPLWQRRILLCPQPNTDLTIFLINDTGIFRCLAEPIKPAHLVQAVEVALEESQRIQQLMAAEAENAVLKRELAATRPPLTGQMKNWCQALPRLMTVVLFSFAGIFILGVITLLALYLFKSLLGIDLIPGAHLSDALPK